MSLIDRLDRYIRHLDIRVKCSLHHNFYDEEAAELRELLEEAARELRQAKLLSNPESNWRNFTGYTPGVVGRRCD